MLYKLSVLVIVLLLPWFMAGTAAEEGHEDHSTEQKTIEGDEHDGHDHGSEDENHDVGAESDTLAGHAEDEDHAGHAEDDDHAEELIIELSPEAVALAGLKISHVTHGRIGSVIELPGEVGFNEDRLAHISPRFAGVALEAYYRTGDYVEAGRAMAVVESNESMTSYTITAPISGWVIERHITRGEYVSEDNSIFVIADLSTVWVNLAVYARDFDRVRNGQLARIQAVGAPHTAEGTIEYVTPIIDFQTRSATARISLPNKDNRWRPGTFVKATVATESQSEALLVEREAIQYLDGLKVVFVTDGSNRFRSVEVVVGESDDRFTRIVSGLGEGDEYVSRGAFELKAKIVTSNLDAHAGHGH